MLTNSSVDIAVNLAEVLVDNKCQVSAMPGSLLSELTRSIKNKNDAGNLVRRFNNKEDIVSTILFGAVGTDTGLNGGNRSYEPSEHDSFMDNYLDELSVLLGNHINFARNVVNKEINKLSEKVTAGIDNYRHREAEDFFNVTYYSLPDVFTTETVQDFIKDYEGKTNLIAGGFEKFNTSAVTEVEDVSSLILIGNEEEDLKIRGFVSSRTGSIVQYLNNNVEEYRLPNIELLEYHLVNFLFYRNLANGMDFNTSEPMGSYKRKVIVNRDYFAASLANSVSMYKSRVKTGMLLAAPIKKFSYFSDSVMDVIIHEEVFAKLAENGLGIETVFGYISSTENDGGAIRVNDLVAQGAKFNDNWNRTRSLYLIHLNNKRIDIFKHILSISFDESIASREVLTEAEQEFVDKDSGFIDTTRRLVYSYIETLCVDDIERLDEVTREIVAKHRFRFSNAYELLSRMADLLKQDENLDPMTAALFSACDYMVDYCLAQTQVVCE